jgi:hypothetical protein
MSEYAQPLPVYTSKRTILGLHVAAIVLHAVSGTLGLLVRRNGDPSQSLVEPLFEFSQGGKGAFITPTPKTLFSVPALLPLCIVEFVTAFFHIVYALAVVNPTVDAIIRTVFDTPSVNSLRWFEYALTATAMSAFGGVNAGIASFPYFLKIVFSGFALQACGYAIELLDFNSPRDRRLFNIIWFVIGNGLNLSGIGILLYQIFGSKTHGAFWLFVQNTVPFALWFQVRFMYQRLQVVEYSQQTQTFGLIARWTFRKWRQFSDPWFAERWYILLSLSTKVATFWLAFATYRKIVEDNGFATKSNINWNIVRFCAMSIPAGWVFLFGLSDWSSWNGTPLIGARRRAQRIDAQPEWKRRPPPYTVGARGLAL